MTVDPEDRGDRQWKNLLRQALVDVLQFDGTFAQVKEFSLARHTNLTEYGKMTDDDLQELLNVKKTRAYLLARQMSENGLIEVVGRGATKTYKLK